MGTLGPGAPAWACALCLMALAPAVAQRVEILAPRDVDEDELSLREAEGGNVTLENSTWLYVLVQITDASTGEVLQPYTTQQPGLGLSLDITRDQVMPGKSKTFDQPRGRNAIVTVITPGNADGKTLTAHERSLHEALQIGWALDVVEDGIQDLLGCTLKGRKGAVIKVLLDTPEYRAKILSSLHEGGAKAAVVTVWKIFFKDLLKGGPITKLALGEALTKELKEAVLKWIARKAAEAGLGPVGEALLVLELIYEGLKLAYSAGKAGLKFADFKWVPAKATFHVAFKPAFYDRYPSAIRRSDEPSTVTILGALLEPREVDGQRVEPEVTFQSEDRTYTARDLDYFPGGWRLRAKLPGEFIRGAKSPLTLRVRMEGEDLGTRELKITEGALSLTRLAPPAAVPGETIEAIGEGFPTRGGKHLLAVFHSESDPTVRVTTRVTRQPRSGRVAIRVPPSLATLPESRWLVDLQLQGTVSNRRLFSELEAPEGTLNLLPNWSFEHATVEPQIAHRLPNQSTAINGWVVAAGSVDYVRGRKRWSASHGRSCVELSGARPGMLATRIDGLLDGGRYELSFDLAASPKAKGPVSMEVEIGDANRTLRATPSPKGLTWERQYLAFTARRSGNVLSFSGRGSGPHGAVIDNLELVPFEPLNLSGRWTGFGYGSGLAAEVQIEHQPSGKLTATAVHEEAGVPEGEVSWRGTLETYRNRFSDPSFSGELQLSLGSWVGATIKVHTRDHLTLTSNPKEVRGKTLEFYRMRRAIDDAFGCLEPANFGRRTNPRVFDLTKQGTLEKGEVVAFAFPVQPNTEIRVALEAKHVKLHLHQRTLGATPGEPAGWRWIDENNGKRYTLLGERTVVHRVKLSGRRRGPLPYSLRVWTTDRGDLGRGLDAGLTPETVLDIGQGQVETGYLFGADKEDRFRIAHLPALTRVRAHLLSVDDGRDGTGKYYKASLSLYEVWCRDGERQRLDAERSVTVKSYTEGSFVDVITHRPGNLYLRVRRHHGGWGHRYRIKTEILQPIRVEHEGKLVGHLGEDAKGWYAKRLGDPRSKSFGADQDAARAYLIQ